MLSALLRAFRTPDLRRKLLFTIGIVVVFRIGSFLPTPGVDYANVQQCVNQLGTDESLLGLVNLFSGGALLQLAVFALGIMPYITASIIVQLLRVVIPRFEALHQEGQSGTSKLTQYTRYLTVGLAILQSTTIVAIARSGQLFSGCSVEVIPDKSITTTLLMVVTMTAGTAMIMWLGELITERGIGNGMSLLIFTQIAARFPTTMWSIAGGNNGATKFIIVIAVVLLVIGLVVFVEQSQRRIPVQYAKRMVGRKMYGGSSTYIPIKINMSGVIPAIFASSLIMFPATASSWFSNGTDIRWLQTVTAALSPGEPLYELLYAVLIIVFAFFYTALVFNSNETAENLKKSGALIPGIRPGRATTEYIDGVLTRLTLAGALYLVAVCLVPTFLNQTWHVPFYFGGTSLLIVVVVVMDFTAQVQAHLVSHQYESLLKKANLKGYGRGGGR